MSDAEPDRRLAPLPQPSVVGGIPPGTARGGATVCWPRDTAVRVRAAARAMARQSVRRVMGLPG